MSLSAKLSLEFFKVLLKRFAKANSGKLPESVISVYADKQRQLIESVETILGTKACTSISRNAYVNLQEQFVRYATTGNILNITLTNWLAPYNNLPLAENGNCSIMRASATRRRGGIVGPLNRYSIIPDHGVDKATVFKLASYMERNRLEKGAKCNNFIAVINKIPDINLNLSKDQAIRLGAVSIFHINGACFMTAQDIHCQNFYLITPECDSFELIDTATNAALKTANIMDLKAFLGMHAVVD